MKPARPHPALEKILRPAYVPCAQFDSTCTTMRWDPVAGHVPRGFLGATGALAEVELVLVFAEPGDPHAGARVFDFESCLQATYEAFAEARDLFHRNVRSLLDACWPDSSFAEQLRKVWLTESVLCSAAVEGGTVPASSWKACGALYLKEQLRLLPNALVVALGSKAQGRLKGIGVEKVLSAYAVAPPGCNRQEARESWKQIPIKLGLRRLDTSCG